MSRKLFGTDGIRGRAGDPPLDRRHAYALGVALAGWIHGRTLHPGVVIGMDTRESGSWLAGSVAQGLRSLKVAVDFAGVVTTPGVAYLARTGDYAAGVMISASHNPFGDNGLISVIIGRAEKTTVHVELWIMSCRVLKRDMELAMLDALVERARAGGGKTLRGTYSRTSKNGMVSNHYRDLGFQLAPSEMDVDNSSWTLDIASYNPKNTHIKV